MKKMIIFFLLFSCLLSLGGCTLNSSSDSPLQIVPNNTVVSTETNNSSIIPPTTQAGRQPDYEDSTIDPTEEIIGETYWITGTIVNFRKAPSTDGEKISQLTRGTEILKIGEDGDWLYIIYGESKGYVHGDYASKYPPINSEDGEVNIVVKKAERLLELWQGETLICSFPIGLGWEPTGHKQVEGDGRTPEGEYYVCVRNSNSSFYLSLGVSYPNKEDAAQALEDGRIDSKTYKRIANAIDKGQCPDWNTPLGGAIMIHGCGSSSDWTAGCIAVDNDVMDLLFEYCPMGTKITILP